MTTTTESNVSYGDRAVALGAEVLRTVVGSGVHGLILPGTDDNDEMGVFIEPREWMYGLRTETLDPAASPGYDQHVWRTRREGERSGHGDTDLTIYSMRKFLRLAVHGNPTVLLPLFAPDSQVLIRSKIGDQLREMRTAFLSQDAVDRFLGFMSRQRMLMMGQGPQGKLPNRPELIAAHGYDTKYASHALRLALQGHEIATTGHLTLPMRPHDRAVCLAVKRGEVTQAQALESIRLVEKDLRRVMDSGRCPLPLHPFLPVISKFSMEAHEAHWFHGRHQ